MGKEQAAMRGRDTFQKYKKTILFAVKLYSLFPLRVRQKLFEKHRNMRGKAGLAVRYCLLKSIARSCGDNVSIGPGAYMFNVQNLMIGNNVSIHPMCYIECGPTADKCTVIGDDVSIAHGATVLATSHTYRSADTDIIRDMPVKYEPVHICSNVWLGAKCTVLCGVTIESGSVVGANAVVTKSVPANCIVAGVPARVIKER